MVWLAAYIPDFTSGRSLFDEIQAYPTRLFHADWLGVDPTTDTSAARRFLFHDCEPDLQQWALTTLRAIIPTAAYRHTASAESPTIPSTYIAPTADRTLRTDWMLQAASNRLGSPRRHRRRRPLPTRFTPRSGRRPPHHHSVEPLVVASFLVGEGWFSPQAFSILSGTETPPSAQRRSPSGSGKFNPPSTKPANRARVFWFRSAAFGCAIHPRRRGSVPGERVGEAFLVLSGSVGIVESEAEGDRMIQVHGQGSVLLTSRGMCSSRMPRRRRYATITSSPGVATEIRYAPGSGGLRGAR
jgi:hypothetical protein